MSAFLFKNQNEREKKIRKVTLLASLFNVFLMVLKIIFGLLIKSTALVADGFHSLSDLATDFFVLVSARLSNRPADRTHPYGHRKFETVASQLIALLLLAIGVGFVWSAGLSIYRQQQNFPGVMVLIVAIISIICKEFLFYKTRKVSKQTESAALYANAWHQRSDSLSSVAVLIGGVVGIFGWGYADQLATIVVGFMIFGGWGKDFL